MGSDASMFLHKDEISQISHETGFTHKQIKRLYNRFTTLDKDKTGYLNKEDFKKIPELHVNPLRDRIIEVLVDDNGQDGKLNFLQFVKVFSTFRKIKGDENVTHSKEKKLKFLFSVYDRDKDDCINKAELLTILNMLVGTNLPEEVSLIFF
jgi:Ca2+-binding EF-hand superfamily protein